MRELAENLQEVHRGDRPSADAWNAMVRAFKALLLTSNGYAGDGFFAHSVKDKSNHPFIEITSTVEIPAFSVFSVSGTGVSFAEPVRIKKAKFGGSEAGSPATLFTNGPLLIPANTIGHAWPIDHMNPALVTVTGTAPTVGQPCGLGWDSFSVHKDRTGLICLSVADSDGRIWVKRAREPIAILGIVTADISAYVPGTSTLGSGTVKVLYRNDSDVKSDAKSPSSESAPWSFKVFNFAQKTIASGEFVVAVECIGVGFVVQVEKDKPATFCEFTLPSALTTSDASKSGCTVVDWWGGDIDPDPTDAGITVYNMTQVGGGYHWAGDIGAHGYAQWDEKLSHWRIYDLNCPA